MLHLSGTNLWLITIGLLLGVLNAIATSRVAPMIAGLFAHRASTGRR